MSITIRKGKAAKDHKKRERTLMNAVSALGSLVELKKVKRKIERKRATPKEATRYGRTKERKWRVAEAAYKAACGVF